MEICLYPANTKYLYHICTTSAQRLRHWSNFVQMLYKCLCLLGRYSRINHEHIKKFILKFYCGNVDHLSLMKYLVNVILSSLFYYLFGASYLKYW